MTAIAYLAGPDVFLPNAATHAATKVEICRRSGFRGFPPLNEDAETVAAGREVWQSIYEKDIAMMEQSDIIIANLTPFAGASADAGTLIAVGWFLGRGKPSLDIRTPRKALRSACGDNSAKKRWILASRVAAYLDFRNVRELVLAVSRGEAPPPTRYRGVGRAREAIWVKAIVDEHVAPGIRVRQNLAKVDLASLA